MIRPIRDWVLFEPVEDMAKTSGGIIVSKGGKTGEDGTTRFGKVVDYGPGCKDMSGTVDILPTMYVSVGHTYLLSQVGVQEFVIKGKPYFMARVTNVLGEEVEGG